MTQTPEQIAASLTKAQRDAVLRAKLTLFGNAMNLPVRNRHHTRVAINLQRKGLVELQLSSAVLTETGQQVRAILEKQHDA